MSACNICGKKCKNKRGLSLHKRLKHPAIVPVDQADNSKTISSNEMKSLDYFYLQDADLPGSFIPIANVTDQNMIDWYKDGITSDDMDVYFTHKLYGHAELAET